MMQQRVHQRSRWGAGCRMHHHANRFVHNNQMVVFEQDIQRKVFGQDMAFLRIFERNNDFGPLAHFGLRIGFVLAVDADRTLLQHPSKTRARQRRLLWHIAGQSLIKTIGRISANSETEFRHG